MRTAPRLSWAAVLAASLILTGCTSGSTTIDLVGTVNDPVRTVAMPILTVPAVNLDAGFSQTDSTTTADLSTTATDYGLGSTQQVKDVKVALGQSVRAGQTLATIDDTTLRAQVLVATADAAFTRSQVDVLSAAIDETYAKAHDLAQAKTTVIAAIDKLTSTRAQLKKTKAQLKQTRSQLVTKLTAAEDLLANYPPVPPPGMPTKDQLTAAIAQLKAGLAKINAGLAKIATAEPQLTAGLAKARSGLTKINDGVTKISDARQQLRDLRELARIAADTASIPISAAQLQLKLTTVTAPVDGVVVWVAGVGDRLAAGASVVQLREAGDTKLSAWLSPSQLAGVCLGDSATVTGDWMTASAGVRATVTRISPITDFPPSTTTTQETHLIRAVEVELATTAALPAGVPVEISITGCRSAAGQTEQDR